jgi:hypothetical protein
MKLIRIHLFAAIALASLVSVRVQANTINGEIWENFTTTTGNENGSLANVTTMQGTRSADVTFSITDPINMAAGYIYPAPYTIGGFLGSGGASILTGGSHAGDDLNNTLFYFTGTVSMVNGQTYHVGHDDGLQLMVGTDLLVDVPGPTAYDLTDYTWTGASGNYSFELAYAEVEGAPAVLALDLPLQSVPDSGSTMAMLGGVLTLMGMGARRFRK